MVPPSAYPVINATRDEIDLQLFRRVNDGSAGRPLRPIAAGDRVDRVVERDRLPLRTELVILAR
jgi:hypothetical protein